MNLSIIRRTGMWRTGAGWLFAWAFAAGMLVAGAQAQELRVGTWKTAQTIQPFFYSDFIPEGTVIKVFPFTNPADQKTALLAGSLDMCGTTIAHAIHSAAQGQTCVLI